MAKIGPVISFIALIVASRTGGPWHLSSLASYAAAKREHLPIPSAIEINLPWSRTTRR
jgi:hypothetical protein